MKIIVKQKPIGLLKAFCRHYCERDLKAMLSIFTKDTIVWGKGADEVRHGLGELAEQFLRDWSQSERCEFIIEKTETDPDHPNWIGALLKAKVTIAGIVQSLTLRGTIITKREAGIEKIHFFHASFPAYTQEIGKSFPN
jgi:hypothetical protein